MRSEKGEHWSLTEIGNTKKKSKTLNTRKKNMLSLSEEDES